VNNARDAGATALAPDELAAFVDRYWAAVRLGLAFHRGLPILETTAKPRGRTKQRPGHNLLERLKRSNRKRCASSPISTCPSPTIWPNKTSG
jgi:hypothetical protein